MGGPSDHLRFNKSEINRAGDMLLVNPQDEFAVEVLEYWRSLHSKILSSETWGMLKFIRHFRCADSAPMQLSSRLKRAVSIIEKLSRFPSIKLSRMQDIVGLRFTYPPGLSGLQSAMDTCRKMTGTHYLLKRTTNYLETPRDSGYRAVHQIFELQSPDAPLHNGLFVEVQFRTRLQHLWAMAVETVGMFYGQALKSSRGDQRWLDFFRLASTLIAALEEMPAAQEYRNTTTEELRRQLRQFGNDQSFFSKLAAIRGIHERDSSGDYACWLLELNLKKETCDVYGFTAEQIGTAHEMYAAKEQTPACLRGDMQIVLVATSSLKALRSNYPSYFLDVAEFLDTIKTI